MKQKFPEKQILTRYLFIETIFTLLGLGILVKTGVIMFGERNYWQQVNSRFEKSRVVIPPNRGNIYSADGELLAATLPEYKIYLDYMVVEKDSVRRMKYQREKDSLFYAKLDSLSDGLHQLFPDVSSASFHRRLREGRAGNKRHWLIYDRRISYLQFKSVSRLPFISDRLSGFHFEKSEQRTNPFGSLALRTIGRLYAGKDTARFGLELSYDSVLRGKPGLGQREKSGSTYVTRVNREPENGCDIVTTIDVGMQDLAEKSLVDELREINAAEGTAMLMEVKTGDIKAIVNMTRDKDGKYHEERNYAVSNLLEPGSVFKTASFMVAFDDGYLHPNDLVNTGNGKVMMHGRYMKDANWRNMGNGVITAAECIQKSSNIGVSTLIDKYYFSQPDKFVDGLYRIGIAEDLHVPIPGYARPNIRHPKKDGSNWSKTALAWMSIGYETQVPPISTLTFYNGIANGGRMMYPRFVTAKKRGAEVVGEYPVKVVRERMCSPQALNDVRHCLELVVAKGTGKKAGSPYFSVAGKTGTAQIWTSKGRTPSYLVSFVGYFPAEAPMYTCIVCIKKTPPASGGSQCGPVFRRIAEGVMAKHRTSALQMARDTLHPHTPRILSGNLKAARSVLTELQIPYASDGGRDAAWGSVRTDSEGIVLSPHSQTKDLVPDVRGMGLRDALFLLEKAGLRVSVDGAGHVVGQSIPAGCRVVKGERINIVLRTDEKTDAGAGVLTESSAETSGAERSVTGSTADTGKTRVRVRADAVSRGTKEKSSGREKKTEQNSHSVATDPKKDRKQSVATEPPRRSSRKTAKETRTEKQSAVAMKERASAKSVSSVSNEKAAAKSSSKGGKNSSGVNRKYSGGNKNTKKDNTKKS